MSPQREILTDGGSALKPGWEVSDIPLLSSSGSILSLPFSLEEAAASSPILCSTDAAAAAAQ